MKIGLKSLLEFIQPSINTPTKPSVSGINPVQKKPNSEPVSNPFDRFQYTTSYTGDLYSRKEAFGTETPYGIDSKTGNLKINVSAAKRGVPEQTSTAKLSPAFLDNSKKYAAGQMTDPIIPQPTSGWVKR